MGSRMVRGQGESWGFDWIEIGAAAGMTGKVRSGQG